MTESELHLTMTSGFACISGSVMAAYINLGVPAQNIITSSVMSIPASIAISKMRIPETDEPVTRGRVVVDRGAANEKYPPANALHAFSKGAVFGLVVAGQILTNVLTVLSLVAAVNGLLTWIGHGFGIDALTLQLVLQYIFYPVAFFSRGSPRWDSSSSSNPCYKAYRKWVCRLHPTHCTTADWPSSISTRLYHRHLRFMRLREFVIYGYSNWCTNRHGSFSGENHFPRRVFSHDLWIYFNFANRQYCWNAGVGVCWLNVLKYIVIYL